MTKPVNGGKIRLQFAIFQGFRNHSNTFSSGMVGELIRNEAELGASPLFMTTERVPLIQYIAMPSPTGSAFVFRAPKLSYTDNVFLLPFNSFVWYCLLGLVLVTTICFSITLYTEWTFYLQDVKLPDCFYSNDLQRNPFEPNILSVCS